jgi:hypothetical protein
VSYEQWTNIKIIEYIIFNCIPTGIYVYMYTRIKKNLGVWKKKLRTAIEWDYGILPLSSIKGLPTDKNVRPIDLPKNT